jgi:hypothetical protein
MADREGEASSFGDKGLLHCEQALSSNNINIVKLTPTKVDWIDSNNKCCRDYVYAIKIIPRGENSMISAIFVPAIVRHSYSKF